MAYFALAQMQRYETLMPKRKPAYTCAGVWRLSISRDTAKHPAKINKMMNSGYILSPLTL